MSASLQSATHLIPESTILLSCSPRWLNGKRPKTRNERGNRKVHRNLSCVFSVYASSRWNDRGLLSLRNNSCPICIRDCSCSSGDPCLSWPHRSGKMSISSIMICKLDETYVDWYRQKAMLHASSLERIQSCIPFIPQRNATNRWAPILPWVFQRLQLLLFHQNWPKRIVHVWAKQIAISKGEAATRRPNWLGRDWQVVRVGDEGVGRVDKSGRKKTRLLNDRQESERKGVLFHWK